MRGYRIQRFQVQGLCKVWDLGFRAYRIQGEGFKV